MRSILPLSRDSPRLLEAPHDALAKHVFGDLAHAEADLRAVLRKASAWRRFFIVMAAKAAIQAGA